MVTKNFFLNDGVFWSKVDCELVKIIREETIINSSQRVIIIAIFDDTN